MKASSPACYVQHMVSTVDFSARHDIFDDDCISVCPSLTSLSTLTSCSTLSTLTSCTRTSSNTSDVLNLVADLNDFAEFETAWSEEEHNDYGQARTKQTKREKADGGPRLSDDEKQAMRKIEMEKMREKEKEIQDSGGSTSPNETTTAGGQSRSHYV